jgi:hypothetical protein
LLPEFCRREFLSRAGLAGAALALPLKTSPAATSATRHQRPGTGWGDLVSWEAYNTTSEWGHFGLLADGRHVFAVLIPAHETVGHSYEHPGSAPRFDSVKASDGVIWELVYRYGHIAVSGSGSASAIASSGPV